MTLVRAQQVHVPTSWTFLTFFWGRNGVPSDSLLRHVSSYYAERMLQADSLLVFAGSVIAAAALAQAQRAVGLPEWVRACLG